MASEKISWQPPWFLLSRNNTKIIKLWSQADGQQITSENDIIHRPYGDHQIRGKLEPLKQDFNEILGDDICNWIVNNYAWFYDALGYTQ